MPCRIAMLKSGEHKVSLDQVIKNTDNSRGMRHRKTESDAKRRAELHDEINEINWTPRRLPCYFLERMEKKLQFRSAMAAHQSSDRCVFGISSTGSMPFRSKRIPTVVTIPIARITMKAQTG